MLIEDFTPAQLATRMHDPGVELVTGACAYHVRTSIAGLVRDLATMYGAYTVQSPGIVDASLRLASGRTWLHPFRSGVRVWIDDERELEGLSVRAAYAAFESGLNWGTALSDVAPFLMHAAVLERHGEALILPAPSGSGKSTLAAALACSGWRLFSDEMAIFRADDYALLPNPRPVSLKNNAIDVIRQRFPHEHVSPVISGTPKGNVAFLRAPRDAVLRCHEPAPAGLVVTPIYRAGATLHVRHHSRIETFRSLTENGVNYASMLRVGFDTITHLVDQVSSYELTYSDLDAAIATIDRLQRAAHD